MQKIVVIVPTYNNPKTIKAVAKDLQRTFSPQTPVQSHEIGISLKK